MRLLSECIGTEMEKRLLEIAQQGGAGKLMSAAAVLSAGQWGVQRRQESHRVLDVGLKRGYNDTAHFKQAL